MMNLAPCSWAPVLIMWVWFQEGEEELSEEEQIMRAIALSLGQDVTKQAKEKEETRKKEEEEKARKLTEEHEREQRVMEPLDKAVLDDFSSKLLPGCLELTSSIAQSVYRVCDLIVALAKRNGESWRNNALVTVHDKVGPEGGVARGVVMTVVHPLCRC